MKNLLISVIIPVYNTKKHIKKCISSIVEQTYTNWELLLVDDQSTDGSGEICKQYADNNSKIRYIEKKSGGSSDTRNHGIEHANGDYFYFVDSDDYCERNLLEVVAKILEKNKATLVIFGYYREKNRIKHSVSYGKGRIEKKQAILSLLSNNNIGNYVWNKVFARELFDDIRFPVGEIFEDAAIMYKIILKCECIYTTDEKLYHYQIRKRSLSDIPQVSQLLYYWKILLDRNVVVGQVYPEQKEEAAVSLVKGAIYIWNQMSRQCKAAQLTEYDFFAKSIRENRKALKNMPLRYNVMGHMICVMPYKYAAMVHFLKGKNDD